MGKGLFMYVRNAVTARAYHYERLAFTARSNPVQARWGLAIGTMFLTLGALDVISTNWALSVGAYEVNHFMRAVMEVMGPFWIIPKFLLQGLVAAMVIWSPNKPTIALMIFTCCWTAAVVANNFVIAINLS